jgi:chromosome segregation ATPase
MLLLLLIFQVTTLKAQQKRINSRNREHAQQELDLLSPVRRRNSNLSSTSDDITSPGRQVLQSPEDDHVVRKRLELKEKEEKLNNVEESNRELRAQLERALQDAKALEEKVKQLECGRQDVEHKLQEAEKKVKDKEDKSKKVEEDHLKACQAIKSFMKRTKDMDREINKLKSELKKRDDRICDLMSELNELQDACNKAIWEAHQLQAQAQVPGGGMPGAFEDVRDMTEEENEV